MPTKNKFKKKFFCLLLFEGTFTSFSKTKSQKEVTKQKESRFFLLFLLADRRIRIRIQEAQKHVDPADPETLGDSRVHKTTYAPMIYTALRIMFF
jgi:hypothetical protein